MLEVLLEALPQRVRDLVEANELLDPEQLRVVPGRARVQTLDDGRYVAEDAGVHECCETTSEHTGGDTMFVKTVRARRIFELSK